MWNFEVSLLLAWSSRLINYRITGDSPLKGPICTKCIVPRSYHGEDNNMDKPTVHSQLWFRFSKTNRYFLMLTRGRWLWFRTRCYCKCWNRLIAYLINDMYVGLWVVVSCACGIVLLFHPFMLMVIIWAYIVFRLMSPGRSQAIIWINAGKSFIRALGTNFNEILIEIHVFSFKKIHLKMSPGKWRPFCLGISVQRAYMKIQSNIYHSYTTGRE